DKRVVPVGQAVARFHHPAPVPRRRSGLRVVRRPGWGAGADQVSVKPELPDQFLGGRFDLVVHGAHTTRTPTPNGARSQMRLASRSSITGITGRFGGMPLLSVLASANTRSMGPTFCLMTCREASKVGDRLPGEISSSNAAS